MTNNMYFFLCGLLVFTNPQNTDGDAAVDGKEPEFDEKKPESEVNVSPSSSAQPKKQDDKKKRDAKGKSHVESFTGYTDFKANFNNLETSIIVSAIPTIRVHKDHPVTQIVGDLSSATQTRSMKRVSKDQGTKQDLSHKDTHRRRDLTMKKSFL
nr:hypothetical protein [Tanacetum cinerariifolium]